MKEFDRVLKILSPLAVIFTCFLLWFAVIGVEARLHRAINEVRDTAVNTIVQVGQLSEHASDVVDNARNSASNILDRFNDGN